MEVRTGAEVVAAFVDWLESDGWTVHTEVAWRSAPGLDIDTFYGQLLPRMVPEDNVRYGAVLPERLVPKVGP
jgi:hypothetical protein